MAKKSPFPILVSSLPKSDPRYQKWLLSLKKRPPPWNKGKTKETDFCVRKISRTFIKKRIDNFAKWRERMKTLGKIRSSYPPFEKGGDLAELIGVVLGDGHIAKFPRTECLTIVANSNNSGFIKRYSRLLNHFFDKVPSIGIHGKSSNGVHLKIYQKRIGKRLGIKTGSRKHYRVKIPKWVLIKKDLIKRYLRGLYEAEGSFCIHKPTYTYKFLFSNKNISLLNNVYKCLKILGFHPHRSKYQIQISKKREVYKAKNMINFRSYWKVV